MTDLKPLSVHKAWQSMTPHGLAQLCSRNLAAMLASVAWPSAGLQAVARSSTSERFAEFVGNSPFGHGGEASSVPAGPSIEFRGYVLEGETLLVSLVQVGDGSRKHAAWVNIDGSFAGYTVSALDLETQRVTLQRDGQDLILPLKCAMVQLFEASAPTMVSTNPEADQKRLAEIADEIRRRRALRQAATQAANETEEDPR